MVKAKGVFFLANIAKHFQNYLRIPNIPFPKKQSAIWASISTTHQITSIVNENSKFDYKCTKLAHEESIQYTKLTAFHILLFLWILSSKYACQLELDTNLNSIIFKVKETKIKINTKIRF